VIRISYLIALAAPPISSTTAYNSSALLLQNPLLALHLANALPALLQQPHAQPDDLLLLVAQPRQQAAHQRSLVLLQELGRHVLQQVGRALQGGLAHLCFGVGQGQLERHLHVLEVASSALSDEYPAEGDERVLSHCVLVVLEVLHQGFGDGSAVLANRAAHLTAELVYQLACFLP
jgi:hypothetical protein